MNHDENQMKSRGLPTRLFLTPFLHWSRQTLLVFTHCLDALTFLHGFCGLVTVYTPELLCALQFEQHCVRKISPF